MKKIFLFAAICAAALVTSCQTKNLEVSESPEMKTMTVTCVIADANTKLGISDQGKVTWEAGDEILFHGKWIGGQYSCKVILEAGNISADGKTATVAIEEFTKGSPSGDQASNLYALYPASAVMADNGASNWRSVHPFSDSNKPLMVGYNKEIDGTAFTFINLCGLISFSVSGDFDNYEFAGNNDETVAYEGYQAEVYWSTDNEQKTNLTKGGTPVNKIKGSLVADGTTIHYICIPNGVNFTGGFNFKFKDGNDIVKVATSNTAVNIPRSGLLKLGNISGKLTDYVAPTTDSHKSSITGATDLSADGAANCYVVTAAGKYKIPVVKGNDKEQSAGEVFGVELVWETYNNTEEVAANSVIAAIDYDGPENYVYFQTPETLKPGNALIAAKNSSGNIIWSWHIWIPDTAITSATFSLGEKQLMDRFLGALTADMGLGLGYQWGRKDPFPGVSAIASDASPMSSAGMAISVVHDEAAASAAVADAIANPNILYTVNDTAWNSGQDDGLWSETKTIYDPCPAGYKVPATGDVPGLFASDLSATVGWTQDNTNMCFGIGDPVTVFPLSGYVDDYSSKFGYVYVGKRVAIWSANGSGSKASAVDIRYDKDPVVHKVATPAKSRVGYIRCVAE